MAEHLNDHKQKFQLERVALFSDAVFAIAITLLVIDIKIPEQQEKIAPTDLDLVNYFLTRMFPRFIGFLVSFFVIGLYWLVHHRMFGYLNHYSRKLLWTNLLFLLSIVLMPFSSAFLSEYYMFPVHFPLAIYTLNILFSGWMSYRMWKVIGDPKLHLSEGLDNKILLKYNTIRAFTIPAIFILILVVSFFNQAASNYILLLLPVISLWIRKYFKKKYPGLMETNSL